ncbi:MAG: DHA2 family efflux MFS transporter permease subunit [Dehalococcoidia bacterium]|nr:DHA2 family efflux MFS transporter permease subunit [Dehalococcoidia bacterium]
MLTRKEIEIMVVVVFGTFMYALDGTIMNIALPNIMAVFNETPDRAQLVISAYTLAAAITMAASAFLVDRFGIKKVYIISLVGFLVGSVLCGLAWNSNTLIFFRIIQGAAGGLLLPCSMAMLVIFIPIEKRGLAMAAQAIPTMLGPALGPVVGGYLVTYWSWRYCFYLNVPVMLIAIPLAIAWLRETTTIIKRFDVKGFIFISIGLICILYALSYAPTWNWDERVIGLLVVGGIAMIIWAILALRTESPVLEIRLFKMGQFTLSVVLVATIAASLFSVIFLVPMFLQNLRGVDAMTAGLLLFSNAIGMMIAMPVIGILYARIGARVPVIVGLLIMTFTGLWLQGLDTTTSDIVFQWVMFLRGVGCGFALVPIFSHALSIAPPKWSTQGSSMINVVQSVCMALAVALFATLLDNFQKTDLAIIVQGTTPDSPLMLNMLSQIKIGLMKAGQTAEAAYQVAIVMLYQYCSLQSGITAFQKDFVLTAILSFIGILPACFLPYGPVKKEGGAPIVI